MDFGEDLKTTGNRTDVEGGANAVPSQVKTGAQSELELTRHIDQKQVELAGFLQKDDDDDYLQMKEFEQAEAEMFSFSPAKSVNPSLQVVGQGATAIATNIGSGEDEILVMESSNEGGKIEPAGGDTNVTAAADSKRLDPEDAHHESSVGYFERVSPNMMDFGFDSYSSTQTTTDKTSKQHEIHEYHSEVNFDTKRDQAPFGGFPGVGGDDPFHVSQSEPAVNIHYGIEEHLDHLVPNTPAGMNSSLDEIQQPNFYESEDSSSNKTDLDTQKTNNISTSQILDNDDFLEDSLPHESAGLMSSQYLASSEPQELSDQKYGMDSFEALEETLTGVESSTKLIVDDRSISPDEFEPLPESSNELKDSSSPIPEPWVGVTTSHPSTQEPQFVENMDIPGYQIEDIIEQKINQEHAEISAFQDFLSHGGMDDLERSDNSPSPNSVNSQSFLSKSEFSKEKMEYYPEDISQSYAGSKEFAAPPQLPVKVEDVPPPIPRHSREVEEEILSKTLAKSEASPPPPVDRTGKVPQIEVCPGPPPPKHEQQEFMSTLTKVEEKAKDVKNDKVTEPDYDEIQEFLPKDTFETIPNQYDQVLIPSAPVSKVNEVPQKKEPEKPSAPAPQILETKTKTVAKLLDWEAVELSWEAQQIFNTLNPKAWFDPNKLHPTVSELVYWRDPKKSGVVFGSVFVVLIALTFLSFISVVAYTSLAVLSGTFAFRVYKNVLQAIHKTQDGHPFKEYLDMDLALQGDKSQEICQAVISYANQTVNKLRHLFLVEDLVDSAKFAAALYILTYVGSIFNGLTLIIIGFVALFATPKFYESNKVLIDTYLDLVNTKFTEISNKVQDALPFGKKEKAQ